MKLFTTKFKSGELHEMHVVANLECCEPSQHLLIDTGKPRKPVSRFLNNNFCLPLSFPFHAFMYFNHMLNTSIKCIHSINYTYHYYQYSHTCFGAYCAIFREIFCCRINNSNSFMLTKIDISEDSAKGAKTLKKLITYLVHIAKSLRD